MFKIDKKSKLEDAGMEELKLRITQTRTPILQTWLVLVTITFTAASLLMGYMNNTYNEATTQFNQQISIINSKITQRKDNHINKYLDELSEEARLTNDEYNSFSTENWKQFGHIAISGIECTGLILVGIYIYQRYKLEKLYKYLRKLEQSDTKKY